MVSQFIYGRRKTGYGQLGDLGDGRYTGEDLSSFSICGIIPWEKGATGAAGRNAGAIM